MSAYEVPHQIQGETLSQNTTAYNTELTLTVDVSDLSNLAYQAIVELYHATEDVRDVDPDNIDVVIVGSESDKGVRTLICDVYSKCPVHPSEQSHGIWFQPDESLDKKCESVHCVDYCLTKSGLASVETYLADSFRQAQVASFGGSVELVVPSESVQLDGEDTAITITKSSAETEGESDDQIDDPIYASEDYPNLQSHAANDWHEAEGLQMAQKWRDSNSSYLAEESCDPQYPHDVDDEATCQAQPSRIIDALTDPQASFADNADSENVKLMVEPIPASQVVNVGSSVEDYMTFGCSKCSEKTQSLPKMRQHLEEHDNAAVRYFCTICGKSFGSTGNVMRHRLTHFNVKLFQCQHCSKEFSQKSHLWRHLGEQKCSLDCIYCPAKFEYRCAMSKHCSESHPDSAQIKVQPDNTNVVVWQCGLCKYECANKKDLAQHMKHHTTRTALNYQCDSCSFVTDYPCRLKRHELSHTQERPYRCGLCQYRGSQIEHVIRHMRTKHNMEPRHTVIESSDDFKVTVVLPSCPQIETLRLTCDVSDIKSQQRSLKESKTEKLFCCHLCKIGFQRPRNLLKHVNDMHADEDDKYVCSVCQKHSDNSMDFLQHLASHKPSPTPVEYTCSYCHMKTDKRRSFIYHMQAKHFKIVHFGGKYPNYGLSDFDPEILKGTVMRTNTSNMTCSLMENENIAPVTDVTMADEKEEEIKNYVAVENAEEVLQVNEGDLVQIGNVIYQVQSQVSTDQCSEELT